MANGNIEAQVPKIWEKIDGIHEDLEDIKIKLATIETKIRLLGVVAFGLPPMMILLIELIKRF